MSHNIVDPFEDTESVARVITPQGPRRHNIVDPFEDTESCMPLRPELTYTQVTTSSIRSRILKVGGPQLDALICRGHNIVDPFEDTESIVILRFLQTSTSVTTSSIRSRILKD